MGEAIEKTSRLYPGLLECNQNLLFMLKCRQFVEMVNRSDMVVCRCSNQPSKKFSFNSSPRPNSPIQTSVIQSTKNYSNKTKSSVEELNQNNTAINGNSCTTTVIKPVEDSDVEMDTDEMQNGHAETCNGKSVSSSSNGYQNGNSHSNNICQNSTCLDNDSDNMGESSIYIPNSELIH